MKIQNIASIALDKVTGGVGFKSVAQGMANGSFQSLDRMGRVMDGSAKGLWKWYTAPTYL